MMRRGSGDVTEEMRERAQRLFGYYERVTRSKRIVDKYCELSYRREYLRALFPDCVLIAIVRRPSAVARSIEQWSAAHGSPDEDWWGVHDRKWQVLCDELLPGQPDAALLVRAAQEARGNADRAVIEWIVGMRDLTRETPAAALDLIVRYEELAADPVRQMSRVLEACGLSPAVEVEQMAKCVVRDDSRGTAPDDEIPDVLRPAVRKLLGGLGYA